MRFARVLPLLGLAALLAACGTKPFVTATGACDGRPVASVQMWGADPVSQEFLDETIESNVIGCGHAAPAARPDPRVVVTPKPKKKSLLRRLTG